MSSPTLTTIFSPTPEQVLDLSGAGTGPFTKQSDNEPMRATYGTSIFSVVPPATPTDFLMIQGSATKLVRLKSIILAGSASAAANIQCILVRRSSPGTGGAWTPVTGVNHDTNDSAPTAVVQFATTLPSPVGTAVGTLHRGRLNLAPAANGSVDRLMWQWGWQNDKAPVLRGASDYLFLNFAGAAWPSGGVLDCDLLWTEE